MSDLTEDYWIASNYPRSMLRHELLPEAERGLSPFGERKLRLFAAACCRRIWGFLIDKRSRSAIEALERFVEGDESSSRMARFATAAVAAATKVGNPWRGDNMDGFEIQAAAEAVTDCTSWLGGRDWKSDVLIERLMCGTSLAAIVLVPRDIVRTNEEDCPWYAAFRKEEGVNADLLREILGNPFRPVNYDPSWRTPEVSALACSIAGERDFATLPILGDAAEEAGCTDAELLSHLRRIGGHVQGCWALDAILGKGGTIESRTKRRRTDRPVSGEPSGVS